MWEAGWGGLRVVRPLVGSRRGAGPFSQLLVSSLSPIGMTAEAVAALRRPALGRQWRETNLTLRRLWGPSHSLPSAQANRDEFMAAVGATLLPITLQCYSSFPSDSTEATYIAGYYTNVFFKVCTLGVSSYFLLLTQQFPLHSINIDHWQTV